MEQFDFSIWSDLVDRIVFNSSETPIYFYTLPESNLIIHAQSSQTKIYFNLRFTCQGYILEASDVTKSGVQIIVDNNKEVQQVLFVRENQQQLLQLKRNSDINDLFKQYVCIFTNFDFKNVDQQQQEILLFIEENEKEQIILQYADRQLQQLPEPETKTQTQKKGKKGGKPQQQVDIFQKIQTIMKSSRNQYKDIMDTLGKISTTKHPILIQVGLFVPSKIENGKEGLQINSSPSESRVFEFVTYHKFDKDPRTILEEHLQFLSFTPQQIYYNDQSALPLIKTQKKLQEEYFLFNMKNLESNRNRLLPLSKRFEVPVPQQKGKLMNVHHYLSAGKQLENSKRYGIRGDYVFYHYMQDGFDDKGWGCAYRSFMSVLSWLSENDYAKRQNIPTHQEIQKLLVQMEDKPVEFVGTSEWIGAFEVSMLIQKLTGIESKILHIQNGPDITEKLYEFKNHFLTQGTPIMYGGGVYAYTLLGIEYNSQGECRFLILDPHYTASDNIKSVIEKGGIQWRTVDIFLPNTFYNFCMPQVQ